MFDEMTATTMMTLGLREIIKLGIYRTEDGIYDIGTMQCNYCIRVKRSVVTRSIHVGYVVIGDLYHVLYRSYRARH